MQAAELIDYSLEKELKIIVDAIVEKCNPEKIILFGSMANGKSTVWSDIDLVVIMNTDLRYIDRLLYVSKAIKSDVPIDFFVYTPEEERRFIETNNLFYTKEVIEKGKVLYVLPDGMPNENDAKKALEIAYNIRKRIKEIIK